MAAPTIEEFPSDPDGQPYALRAGSRGKLPLRVDPESATIRWTAPNQSAPLTITPEGDYQEDGQSLVIAAVDPEAHAGEWKVAAEADGETVEKRFAVKVDPVTDKGEKQTAPPGEWDWGWALLAIAFAVVLLTTLLIASWRLLASSWDPSQLPAAIAFLIAIAGCVALAGAVAAALLEIRGRMRARAVAQDLSTRGLGWPGADQAKAISEILKGYGGLTETAMLGATALGLLITAAVLAWHLPTSSAVNKKPQARVLGQLAVTVTNMKCSTSFKTVNGRRALAAKKPGRYQIVIKDQSSKTGFALTGASIHIVSPASARGPLTLRRNLAKGTYRMVCRPAGKKWTTSTFKIG